MSWKEVNEIPDTFLVLKRKLLTLCCKCFLPLLTFINGKFLLTLWKKDHKSFKLSFEMIGRRSFRSFPMCFWSNNNNLYANASLLNWSFFIEEKNHRGDKLNLTLFGTRISKSCADFHCANDNFFRLSVWSFSDFFHFNADCNVGQLFPA